MQTERYSRREFLARVYRYSSLSMMALLFGYDLSAHEQDLAKSTALLYATRYGATKDTAQWIQNGMRTHVDLLDIERVSFSDVLTRYDRFIVGSGIWTGGVHKKVIEFFETGRNSLEGKILATFLVCGTEESTDKGRARIEGYFNVMHASLVTKPSMSKAFGGRIIVEKLFDDDRKALTAFYNSFLHDQLRSWDHTDPEKARCFGTDAEYNLKNPRLGSVQKIRA